VTPETRYFLDKARKLLAEADAILAIKLYDVVGRTAYLAGFHATGVHLGANRKVGQDAQGVCTPNCIG
jgi:hypothetical protein